MKILVKFPSRERPHKWYMTIKRYIELSSGQDIKYLITLDSDDPLLLAYKNYCEILKSEGVTIEYIVGLSNNKIHAVNRDMDKSGEFDILVLASDDMICQVKNWDVVLRNEMWDYYPDTDGALFHWDGDANTAKHNSGQGLCTMCILGELYFERFGYIYNPEYTSLWCDNEYTEVGFMLNKMTKFDQVLFRHEHFSNNSSVPIDRLMRHTQSFYKQDEQVYLRRKEKNFDL